MQSETLAEEFARLVREYRQDDGPGGIEAWNLIADFAVDNADTIEAALSTDAEPTIYVSRKSLEELLEAKGSHVALQTLIHRKPLKSGNGVPLYAEPVKTAPAVAVSREEMAERLFGTDWPNDKWDRFKDGDHAKERYLRMADTALSAQVQDVAGWQPIETAPKDGSKFIAWHPHGYVDFFHWQKHENTGWRDSFIQVYREGSGPAHWMPLPASPASKHGDAE